MTKSYLLVIVAMVVLASASGAAVWLLRDKLMDAPTPLNTPFGDATAQYDALVQSTGATEEQVRDELNYLVATASVKLNANDTAKRDRLTSECLDAKVLLDLDLVRAYVAKPDDPYVFVAEDRRAWLKELVGDDSSAKNIVAIRKALAKLGGAFERLRQPPEWKVNIEPINGAAPPEMPYLDMLRAASTFMPPTAHPTLRAEPRLPVFSGAEAELLTQLEHYFNLKASRSAFPLEKFPNLYHQGRVLPIPTSLLEYRQAIVNTMAVERKILLPTDNPDKAAIEAVDEVYSHLERFFVAIEQFSAAQ